MGHIIVKNTDDKIHKLEANIGSTLMEIIRDAGLDIEAACGGCCACATCHVHVDPEWIDIIKPIDDDEESMLDQAFGVERFSRLSCQIEYEDFLDGIKLSIVAD